MVNVKFFPRQKWTARVLLGLNGILVIWIDSMNTNKLPIDAKGYNNNMYKNVWLSNF